MFSNVHDVPAIRLGGQRISYSDSALRGKLPFTLYW